MNYKTNFSGCMFGSFAHFLISNSTEVQNEESNIFNFLFVFTKITSLTVVNPLLAY